jgi:hypothetical protein
MTRRIVRYLAGRGTPYRLICRAVDLASLNTLKRHYRKELDIGRIEAGAAMAEAIYNKGLGDGPDALTAAIYWMSCRAGWPTERDAARHPAPPGILHLGLHTLPP